MARQKNDGMGRMGGRAKGTPNKITQNTKEWLNEFLTGKREQVERDFMALSPKDRINAYEKLLQYVTPRMQNIKGEMEMGTFERLLMELPDEPEPIR